MKELRGLSAFDSPVYFCFPELEQTSNKSVQSVANIHFVFCQSFILD